MLRWWSEKFGAGSGTSDAETVVQLAVAGSQISQAMATADHRLGLRGLSRVQRILRKLRAEVRKEARDHLETTMDVPTRFVVDAFFLEWSFRFLCRYGQSSGSTSLEAFHYVAGIRIDAATYVFGHVVPVTFAEQTSTRVRVASGSNITALERLEVVGMPLVGHIHTHPGRGAGATHPSITDRRFQERLERGGHVAVGAIFAAGGRDEAFVRFYATDGTRFEIDVRGKNIEEVENHAYRLRLADGDISGGNGANVVKR